MYLLFNYNCNKVEHLNNHAIENFLIFTWEDEDLLDFYLKLLGLPQIRYKAIAIEPISKKCVEYTGEGTPYPLTMHTFYNLYIAGKYYLYLKYFTIKRFKLQNFKLVNNSKFRYFKTHISFSTNSIKEDRYLYDFLKENIEKLDLSEDYVHIDPVDCKQIYTKYINYKELPLDLLKRLIGTRKFYSLTSTIEGKDIYYASGEVIERKHPKRLWIEGKFVRPSNNINIK